MKALTVCQPCAAYIASGEDRTEKRRWSTRYRGPLAIHAGSSRKWLDGMSPSPDMVFGAVVAVARLVACVEDSTRNRVYFRAWCRKYGYQHLLEEPYYRHVEGPVIWVLDDIRPLCTPVAMRGHQRLWGLDAETIARIERELA